MTRPAALSALLLLAMSPVLQAQHAPGMQSSRNMRLLSRSEAIWATLGRQPAPPAFLV